jgi:hypothetical protein
MRSLAWYRFRRFVRVRHGIDAAAFGIRNDVLTGYPVPVGTTVAKPPISVAVRIRL